MISSVEKQQKAKRNREVLKKRKNRNLAEPEISNISNILTNSLNFVSPTSINGGGQAVTGSKDPDSEVDMEGVELLEVVDEDAAPEKQNGNKNNNKLLYKKK